MFFCNLYRILQKIFILVGIIFLVVSVQISSAWAQLNKPSAVVVGLIKGSTPRLSEQILLEKFKEELLRSFNLNYQSEFEKKLLNFSQDISDVSCKKIKCILKAHSDFKHTRLFLFKIKSEIKSLSLIMIDENGKWITKHEICSSCGLSLEDMLKNIVYRMEAYSIDPELLINKRTRSLPKISIFDSKNDKQNTNKVKKTSKKFLFESANESGEKIQLLKSKSPLEKLQFKIAQTRYNQLIWKNIKKELMFFRQKNIDQSISNLKARLRLQIDENGEVIERRLLDSSGSEKFDESILDSVDLLKLPPPMKNLISSPPYVVTIVIQP